MSENVRPERHLTGPQRAALDALASGASRSQAAAIANRTERTLARWLDEPAFQSALSAVTDRAIADAARRLATTLSLAVDTIGDLLADDDTPAHVRLRAAQVAIDSAVKLRELTDLADRVAALEKKIL